MNVERVARTNLIAGAIVLGIAGTMLYLTTVDKPPVVENQNYYTGFYEPLPEVIPVDEPQVADLPPLQEGFESSVQMVYEDLADLSHTPYALPDIADLSIEAYEELPEILPPLSEVDLPPLES